VSERVRRWAVPTLVALTSVTAVLALVVGYVRHAAADSDQFANRATVALRDDSVKSLIAERVTDQLILKNARDLVAARPIIESVVSSFVGGRAFTGAFRKGADDVHRAVFDRDRNTVTLTVGDIGTLAAAGVEVIQPGLAQRVRTTNRVELIHRHVGDMGATAVRATDDVRLLAWIFVLLAVGSAAGAVTLSRDRRRTSLWLGGGLAVGGMVLIV